MKKIQADILQEERQNKRGGIVSETILLYLLLSGFVLSLKDLSYSNGCVIGAMVSATVVILFFQKVGENNKTAEMAHRIFYIVCVVCSVASFVFLLQGFLYMTNLFIQLWNLRFGTETVLLSTGEGAAVGSVILWIIAGAVLGNVSLTQIKKRRMSFPILMITAALAFSGILAQSNIWPGMILLLASLLGLFIFYSVPQRSLGAYGGCCIGVAVLFMLILTVFSSGYRKSANIEQYKYNVVKAIEKFRYGEDSLPQGDFQKAKGLLNGKEIRLRLSTDTPQELYLKGFVGGEYEGTCWKPLSSEKYAEQYEGMLDWLQKNKFLPATQYASYDKLSKESSGEQTKYQKISVTNVDAYRKFVYLPSALSSWERAGTKIEKDWNVYSTAFLGAKNYTFDMIDNARTAEAIQADSWTQSPATEAQQNYLNTESVYHSFVEDSYLTISEEQKALIEDVFFKKDQEKKDFTEVTTQIRQVLRSEMDYKKIPESFPSDKDFLEWFLKEKKEGNAVAFATAAVMAYRTAGYPARYVEGYHLSAKKAENLSKQDAENIALTTQDAHAWVEVYVTGIGWLPVEVVPGLYTETYTNETVEGKPAYKINSQSNDQGLDTGEDAKGSGIGSSDKKGRKNKKHEKAISVIVAYIILLWITGTLLYLLLELQRMFRLHLWKKEKEKAVQEDLQISFIIKQIRILLIAGKIKGDYSQKSELWIQIEKKFPGIEKEEYERVLTLIQKARFGGMALKTYEIYTLECFEQHLRTALYHQKNIIGKIYLRYIKLL